MPARRVSANGREAWRGVDAEAPPEAVGAARGRQDLWRRLAYVCGAVAALGIGYFLVRMPLQLSDNLGNMLAVQAASLREILLSTFTSKAFLRPLLWAQVKVLFDVSHGHYFLTFKVFHVAQVLVLVMLFIRLLNVRSRADFVAVPLSTAVLIGIHTFSGTVREAFPVNTFMTVLVCSLLAVNLSFSRGGRWVDGAAVVLFAFALLTLETGILVWVCLAVGYLVGFRGVSAKAVVASTVLLVLYVGFRFNVGAPDLTERSSGFGFSVREPSELVRMFGDDPRRFYAYNVVSSVLTVFFSEPRAGVWEFTRTFLGGGMPPWIVINVVSSVVATLFIARFAVSRYEGWLRGVFQHDDRIFILFLAVVLGNAAISYPYTKDVIMSPAGVFYALAVFVALRDALDRFRLRRARPRFVLAFCAALLTMSSLWSMRALGLPYNMRYTAFVQRNDWARAHEWLAEQGADLKDQRSLELVETLRRQALGMSVPNPHFVQRWAEPYFDKH